MKFALADDRLTADDYYRRASEGAAFVYVGDFQNAKQLLQAVQRRIEKKSAANRKKFASLAPKERFLKHRLEQSHRAQILGRLYLPIESDLTLKNRRAPEVSAPLSEAGWLDPSSELLESSQFTTAAAQAAGLEFSGQLISLKDLLGMIGAHEWRKRGVFVAALGATVHAHYGLFAPVRSEYLDLVAKAPLPTPLDFIFDIGTGTGVLAAILAKRTEPSALHSSPPPQIMATDLEPRAIACAKENLDRLGSMAQRIALEMTDLFPKTKNQKADLIVCNPPWLPARPTSRLERAVYDEDGRMLKTFLTQASEHLTSTGEVWLILSDLAERLGLRAPGELENLFAHSKLKVIEALETRPIHKKTFDESDLLQPERANEITRLWRLKKINA